MSKQSLNNKRLFIKNQKENSCQKKHDLVSASRAKIALERLKKREDLIIFFEIMKKPKGLSE